MEYEDMLDLFFECFESNEDSEKLAFGLIASGSKKELVNKAQTEASRLYSKHA